MAPDSDRNHPTLILARFGITLSRMTESDKQIVREARNADFVRQNHVYRELITKEQHEAWFQEMNSPANYVLVITVLTRKVGVVIVKDIPTDLSTSTCGAFIWDREFLSTRVPIISILIALDFFYCSVGVNATQSVVLKSNLAAINMNRFFGFTFAERDDSSYLITMSIGDYKANRDRLMAFARRATKNAALHELTLNGQVSASNLKEINAMLTIH